MAPAIAESSNVEGQICFWLFVERSCSVGHRGDFWRLLGGAGQHRSPVPLCDPFRSTPMAMSRARMSATTCPRRPRCTMPPSIMTTKLQRSEHPGVTKLKNAAKQARNSTSLCRDYGGRNCQWAASGQNRCLALATGSNGAWASDIGNYPETAQAKAIAACQKNGGLNCRVPSAGHPCSED